MGAGLSKMIIYVITGSDGKIVGTMRAAQFQGDVQSQGDVSIAQPLPLPGQKVHEVELPKELEQINDPDELHRQLAQLLEDKTDQDKDLVS